MMFDPGTSIDFRYHHSEERFVVVHVTKAKMVMLRSLEDTLLEISTNRLLHHIARGEALPAVRRGLDHEDWIAQPVAPEEAVKIKGRRPKPRKPPSVYLGNPRVLEAQQLHRRLDAFQKDQHATSIGPEFGAKNEATFEPGDFIIFARSPSRPRFRIKRVTRDQMVVLYLVGGHREVATGPGRCDISLADLVERVFRGDVVHVSLSGPPTSATGGDHHSQRWAWREIVELLVQDACRHAAQVRRHPRACELEFFASDHPLLVTPESVEKSGGEDSQDRLQVQRRMREVVKKDRHKVQRRDEQ